MTEKKELNIKSTEDAARALGRAVRLTGRKADPSIESYLEGKPRLKEAYEQGATEVNPPDSTAGESR